jgi:ribosomal protein S27AE
VNSGASCGRKNLPYPLFSKEGNRKAEFFDAAPEICSVYFPSLCSFPPLKKGGPKGDFRSRMLISAEEKMTTQKTKMICPRCGAEMNHHADKVVYPVSAQEAEIMDLVLGGVIEETHCCPGCGGVESRRANE